MNRERTPRGPTGSPKRVKFDDKTTRKPANRSVFQRTASIREFTRDLLTGDIDAEVWRKRRLRHLNEQYGVTENVKDMVPEVKTVAVPFVRSVSLDPTSIQRTQAAPQRTQADKSAVLTILKDDVLRFCKGSKLRNKPSALVSCNPALVSDNVFRGDISDIRPPPSKTELLPEPKPAIAGSPDRPLPSTSDDETNESVFVMPLPPDPSSFDPYRRSPSPYRSFGTPSCDVQMPSNQEAIEMEDFATSTFSFYGDSDAEDGEAAPAAPTPGTTFIRSAPEQPCQRFLQDRHPILKRFDRFKKFTQKVTAASDDRLIRLKKYINDRSVDYRPFFTYWVITVQFLVLMSSLFLYGFTQIDIKNVFDITTYKGTVMTTAVTPREIEYFEINNVWLGPRFADLVQIGAKYRPCMYRDAGLHDLIMRERAEESSVTGCCISPFGCYQTSECPSYLGKLVQYSNSTGQPRRVVCGQDPHYCNQADVAPSMWTNNITKWPVCKRRLKSHEEHMKCSVISRPCCIQLQGQCRITTKTYCDFVKGHYHPNATLCSQVSCLNDICGMGRFSSRDEPDQWYRMITAIFIHAGILQFIITFALHFYFVIKFEKMYGWWRVAVIYLTCGIGGYLASAVFTPYWPSVGPFPSLAGIHGVLLIEAFYNWAYIKTQNALAMHLLLPLVFVGCGILPFVDMVSILVGLVLGCLLAYPMIPYMKMENKIGHYCLTAACLVSCALIFLFLSSMFSSDDLSQYPSLSYLACIPFSEHICDHQGLTVKSWIPI